MESRASVLALALGHIAVINGCYLKSCLFCHKRTPTWVCEAIYRGGIFYPWRFFFFFFCIGWCRRTVSHIWSTLLTDNSPMEVCWLDSFIKILRWANEHWRVVPPSAASITVKGARNDEGESKYLPTIHWVSDADSSGGDMIRTHVLHTFTVSRAHFFSFIPLNSFVASIFTDRVLAEKIIMRWREKWYREELRENSFPIQVKNL